MAKTQEPGITKIEGTKETSYRIQIRIKNKTMTLFAKDI